MAEKAKVYYVGIASPSSVREQVLTSSKEMISILKRYDSMVDIRQDKIAQITLLKKAMAEIRQLQTLLKQKMPEENGAVPAIKKDRRAAPVRAIAPKKMVRKIIAQARPTETPDPEIASLEAELAEIESRLNRLSKR